MTGIEHFLSITSIPHDNTYRVGFMTLCLYKKKVKTREHKLFGQSYVDYKQLNLDFNPTQTQNLFLLSIVTLPHLRKVVQTATFFPNILAIKVTSRLQVHPSSLNHPSTLLSQLIYNPLYVFLLLLNF